MGKNIDQMISDLQSLNERFLNPEKRANLDQVDKNIEKQDKGIDSIDKKQDDGVSSGPKVGQETEQDKEAEPKSADQVVGEMYENVIPAMSQAVESGARHLAMLVRAIPMLGMPQNKMAEMFGDGYPAKMSELGKALEQMAEYYKPKNGMRADEVKKEDATPAEADPNKMVGVQIPPTNKVEAGGMGEVLSALRLADGRMSEAIVAIEKAQGVPSEELKGELQSVIDEIGKAQMTLGPITTKVREQYLAHKG